MDPRPSPQPAPQRTTGIAGRLNHEWTEQLANMFCPTSWSERPALADCLTLQDVIDLCAAGNDRETKDEVIHALICLAQDGCNLAQRTLIQTMLAKIVRLSKTAGARGVEGPVSYTLTTFLEAVQSFPRHQRRTVAGTLALNTLHAFPPAPDVREHLFSSVAGEMPSGLPRTADDVVAAAERDERWHSVSRGQEADRDQKLIARALSWALDTKALTEVDVRILAHRYLADDGQLGALKDVAAALDLSPEYVRQRHAKALRRLAQTALHRAA